MEELICPGIIIIIITLSVFSYLRNTARKNKPTSKPVKRDYQPVYISIADKPDSIILGMDRFVAEVNKTESAGDKWRQIPMLIFLGGLGLMAVDLLLFLLGFRSYVFVAGGLVVWIAAVVLARGLRKSDSKDFSPRYKGVKETLYTLRDDLKPGGTFNGHLDLTGAMLKTKVAREAKDSRDRTTRLHRQRREDQGCGEGTGALRHCDSGAGASRPRRAKAGFVPPRGGEGGAQPAAAAKRKLKSRHIANIHKQLAAMTLAGCGGPLLLPPIRGARRGLRRPPACWAQGAEDRARARVRASNARSPRAASCLKCAPNARGS
jgi:hypothetical protein